ncbi:hypothetical protein EVAR_89914_1 [Eumeta japonica]|uniref:Fatty acid synthase n=1 Tax=Eumeta variegata TaxID=151549 RepID=A0A4C1XRK2_EUMVA|nr:hypothetical protein EVAR_89914_1 [Eumeta japonica]
MSLLVTRYTEPYVGIIGQLLPASQLITATAPSLFLDDSQEVEVALRFSGQLGTNLALMKPRSVARYRGREINMVELPSWPAVAVLHQHSKKMPPLPNERATAEVQASAAAGTIQPDDVVISGMSGTYANCHNVSELFEKLYAKVDIDVISY